MEADIINTLLKKNNNFIEWYEHNPKSVKTLKQFLFKEIVYAKGVERTLKRLKTSRDQTWFSYFSELRCAKELRDMGICITEYNAKDLYTGCDVDLLLNNNLRCDVTSYKAKWDPLINGQVTKHSPEDYKEKIKYIETKLKNKKADIIILDDVFSEYQGQHLFSLYLEYRDNFTVDQWKILDRLVIFEFHSLTGNVKIAFIGDIVKEYFKGITLPHHHFQQEY